MKKKRDREKLFSAKSQALNIGVIVFILGLTFFVLFRSLYDPDNPIDFSELLRLEWGWILLGPLFVFLSVFCEARNLSLILREIGHHRSWRECTVYASSDIYFSSITPSATGGQPAAAFYMTKSGIPLSQSSAVLVLNVTFYTVGLIVFTGIAFLLRPEFYASFAPTEKLCVWLGLGFHALLAAVCILFMVSRKMVLLVGGLIIRLLSALHIFKNREEKMQAFRASIETYRSCLTILKKNPSLVFRLLFYSVMQRLILTPITYLVFLSMGIEASLVDVVAMQIYCTVGASAVPLPGAMGISEALYVLLFKRFIPDPNRCMFSMVLSRSVSGYLAILFCGYVTMSHHIRATVRARREAEALAEKSIGPAEDA
ncbi:MAG: flippase-like domain-containing protein [Clostridia bacterium]|nr:flippase-like domain-containing protein [Clostridia bacterium]